MNVAKLTLTAVAVCAGSWVLSDARAGGRDSRGDVGTEASFRITSPGASEGFVPMKTGDGTTVYVSQTELFSAQDVAGFRTISADGRESLELSLPSRASDRLTSAIRGATSKQLAIVREKKLLAVAQVDLDAGAQPRIVGLPVGGADRITRLIKRAPEVRSVANVSVVPRQASGRAGDLFTVDVYVGGVTGIRTYQFKMGVQGGTAGELKRDSGAIDQTRADFLFGDKQEIVAVDELNGRFAGTTFGHDYDATTPKYVGSYSFRASPDASGAFNVGVVAGSDTFISTAVGDIPYRATGATITVTP